MKSKRLMTAVGLITMTSLLLLCPPLYAEDTNEELKKKIEALQKRVEELEAVQNQPKEDNSWGLFNRRQSSKWDPFSEMNRMQEEMDRMFQHSFSSRGLSNGGMFSSNMSFDSDFDMKETDTEYAITFNMKGLDQEKIDIDINEHSVTVKGEHSREDTEENQNAYFSSMSYGSFMKTIPLPVDADTSKVKTDKEGDTLVIRLPKKIS